MKYFMKKILKCKKVISLALVLVISLSCFNVAFAQSTRTEFPVYGGSSYTLTYGGTYTFHKITSTSTQFTSIAIPRTIKWYSPTQVKALYNAKAIVTSDSDLISIITLAVETAAGAGIPKATEVLTKKYGAKIVSAVSPYLAAFTWAKTAVDFLSLVNSYLQKKVLEDAISKNKGLVYFEVSTASTWHLWDGSAGLGSYPTATIPNYLDPTLNNKQVTYYGQLAINLN